ncbi:hypothetical protein [Agathobacter rectalis]|mgnify:FL=1
MSNYINQVSDFLKIDRSKLENVILLADRGYENYNIFAHAIEKG